MTFIAVPSHALAIPPPSAPRQSAPITTTKYAFKCYLELVLTHDVPHGTQQQPECDHTDLAGLGLVECLERLLAEGQLVAAEGRHALVLTRLVAPIGRREPYPGQLAAGTASVAGGD